MSERRQRREAAADRAREELLRTLSELDRRRHDAFDLRAQLERHRPQVLTSAALFGVGFLALGALRRTRKKARARRELGPGPGLDWGRAWTPPLGLEEPRRSTRMPLVLGALLAAVALPFALRAAKARKARALPTPRPVSGPSPGGDWSGPREQNVPTRWA